MILGPCPHRLGIPDPERGLSGTVNLNPKTAWRLIVPKGLKRLPDDPRDQAKGGPPDPRPKYPVPLSPG